MEEEEENGTVRRWHTHIAEGKDGGGSTIARNNPRANVAILLATIIDFFFFVFFF